MFVSAVKKCQTCVEIMFDYHIKSTRGQSIQGET